LKAKHGSKALTTNVDMSLVICGVKSPFFDSKNPVPKIKYTLMMGLTEM